MNTQKAINEQKKKFRPSNEIDLQNLTIIPHISSEEVSEELTSKFKTEYIDENGNIVLTKDYWGIMHTFVPDWRLGNTSKEEVYFIRYHLDLFCDVVTLMPNEFNRASQLLLFRATNINETSQGKAGFFRKIMNSIFQHQSIKEETPEKRGFFGFGKKNKGDN